MKSAMEIARKDGRITGEGDADAYNRDPENFEPSQPNPFGMDSQPELHEAWQNAYENAFESQKGQTRHCVIPLCEWEAVTERGERHLCAQCAQAFDAGVEYAERTQSIKPNTDLLKLAYDGKVVPL